MILFIQDITIQQLCDKHSVHLLETCTRFHIFCAHRLSELEPIQFDDKINTENLTKCLQTLKEMYADLRHRGDLEACKNENEFRGYLVLMNLNEGDILRYTATEFNYWLIYFTFCSIFICKKTVFSLYIK